MPEPPEDAVTAGRIEGAATFQVAAEAYDRYVGRYSPALAAALVERAEIAPGLRVLDVGCGPGALVAEAARIVGPAQVAAVDPSPPFVEACRVRTRGADVRLAAAESLPFADGVFDAVLSQLVVNFLSDAPLGVAEMRRVAKPGGVVAACVWDYAGGMRMLRAFWDAAVALDPEGAGSLDEGSMPYCNPEELEKLWSEAGLDDVEVSPLQVEASYTDFDDLWTPFTAGVGPAGAYCASLDLVRQDALRERLRAELGRPIGPFALTARAWCALGRRRRG